MQQEYIKSLLWARGCQGPGTKRWIRLKASSSELLGYNLNILKGFFAALLQGGVKC